MTDISKCQGIDCEKKEQCYRYTAPTSSYQSYAPFDRKDRWIEGQCKDFIDNSEWEKEND